MEYLPIAVIGHATFPLPVHQVADEYRAQFGIETGHW